MALEYVDSNGSFVIPGAYPNVTVQASNSGLAATGILMVVGEADAGPAFDQEADLSQNIFTPDQGASVAAKYKAGSIVDAFNAACSASADPGIAGSFAGMIIAKTNVSVKASALLKNPDATNYGTLQDKSFGKLGNLIYQNVIASSSESLPSTGAFNFVPPQGTVALSFRINGGAALAPANLAANATPADFVAACNSQAGIKASGGADRAVVPGSGATISITVNGNLATFASNVAFVAGALVGDTLYVSSASDLKGAGSANAGGYIVTAVSANAITALKVVNCAIGIGSALVAPVAMIGTDCDATDLKVFAPVTVALDPAVHGDLVQGLGKSLEINEKTTGTDLLSRYCWLSNGMPAAFVSKSAAPTVIGSVQEYVAQLNINRQADNIAESVVAGGDVVLGIGYKGSDAVVTISPTKLTVAVAGGVGSNLDVTLKDFPTVADLAAYINAQPGFSAVVGNVLQGSVPSIALDQGTFNAVSEFGAAVCRVKADAYKFFNAVLKQSQLVQLAAKAAAGLPAVSPAFTFLSGGSKGATTNARVTGAIDALERVRGNFLITLFSRDAGNVISGDIAEGLTDAASSYTIDNINAYAKSHVIKCSTVKRRRNRQAFVSKQASFVDQQKAAATIAHYRCAVTFEDDKTATSQGVTQFGPWMLAVKAAAMQAAGFYKSLVHKYVNTSGVVQAAGDWTYNDDGNVEAALKAGLLPVGSAPGGGFYFISDQTSYGKDSNFVFNSIQMVYAADIVALTTAQRMEQAFVGQSLADVSAAQALSYLDGIMADFRRLKLIAYSDDAPLGYKNAKVVINGPAMQISVEVKIAGSIYFIPISFYVTQITQTAAQ